MHVGAGERVVVTVVGFREVEEPEVRVVVAHGLVHEQPRGARLETDRHEAHLRANELAAGARDAAAGGAQLADGVAEYTGLVNSVVSGVIDSSGTALPYAQQMRDVVAVIPPELWPADAGTSQQQTLEILDALIAESRGQYDTVDIRNWPAAGATQDVE